MRTLSSSLVVLPLTLVASVGCYTQGDAGYLGFRLVGLEDPLVEFQSGDHVLAGSRVCPSTDVEWEVELVDDPEAFRACFDESIAGPGAIEADGCLRLDGPGEVAWTLTPDTCGSESETLRFDVVTPDEVVALVFDEWRLRWGRLGNDEADLPITGLAPGRTLDDLLDDPTAARRFIAGEYDTPLMRLDGGDGWVWWSRDQVTLEVVGTGFETYEPEPPTEPEPGSEQDPVEFRQPGELLLTAPPGSVGQVLATLPDGTTRLSPDLIAVAPTEAASVDLVTADIYLYADVLDADGNRLHGAPVEWDVVEGALAINPGDLTDSLRTGDYATFAGGCLPPPEVDSEQRSAVVRARYLGFEDTIQVNYEVDPPGGWGSDEWEPPAECLYAPGLEPGEQPDPSVEEGCACSTDAGDTPPIVPLVFGLGILLGVRRRRVSLARRRGTPSSA